LKDGYVRPPETGQTTCHQAFHRRNTGTETEATVGVSR
jgi:hypothetical protein